MKNTTQQIITILKSDNFTKLYELKAKVDESGWNTKEYQEVSFTEAFSEIENIKDILIQAIESKNNLFENATSFQERQNIHGFINNLNSYITNIKNGSDQVNNFIQFVQQLKEITRKIGIELNIQGYPAYQEKLKQLNYLKSKYEDLISKLNKAEELKKSSEEVLKSIQDKQEKIKQTTENIEANNTKITSIKEDIEKRHENIKTINTNITEYKAAAEQNEAAIKTFFSEIDEYEKEIKNGLEKITETIKTSKEKMDSNIKQHAEKTEDILNQNKTLQDQILDILGKSIGTNLYLSFKEKAKWMKYQAVFWLILLGLSIWFLSSTGAHIFQELKPFFENGKITDLTLTFYLRLTLIFPAIYAVYFCAHQFQVTSKLLEEYDFKSSVAVALHHFKELVEKSKENDKTQSFLTESIHKIFESPTEKVFGKKAKEKDIENKAKDIVSSVVDIAGQILPRDK
ncbi:hypothetical protein KKB58_00540 [Patescibacteria group bacterium]|nr:hypothetical protein [Patescibacteria group bacterium]